jgi:hypothetical protein
VSGGRLLVRLKGTKVALFVQAVEFVGILDPVYEDNAVGVVDFVLHDPGQEAGGGDADLLAV